MSNTESDVLELFEKHYNNYFWIILGWQVLWSCGASTHTNSLSLSDKHTNIHKILRGLYALQQFLMFH